MMNADILKQVCHTVASVFLVDANQVTAESSPETIEAWDSLGHLNLMLAIEQEFGVSFDPVQIPKLTSVAALVEAIDEQKS